MGGRVSDTIGDAKKRLRQQLLRRRKHNCYTGQQHTEMVEVIASWLRKRPHISDIMLYLPVNNEPDLSGLQGVPDLSCVFSAPRTEENSQMNFYTFTGDQLISGRYGILEPDPDKGHLRLAGEHSLILLPAVAMDSFGYRLGYGGGYYDRYLERTKKQSPLTMGVVWEEFFLTEPVPVQEWDFKTDYIVTEKGVRKAFKHP